MLEKRATKLGYFSICLVKFTSNHVGWLVILSPGVGWDIMGYESDPLPSYPDLRNCSYSLKLITHITRLFLRIISNHVYSVNWNQVPLNVVCLLP